MRGYFFLLSLAFSLTLVPLDAAEHSETGTQNITTQEESEPKGKQESTTEETESKAKKEEEQETQKQKNEKTEEKKEEKKEGEEEGEKKEEKKEEENKEEKKEEKEKTEEKKEEGEVEPEVQTPRALGNWCGWRDYYKCRGLKVEPNLYVDDVWNLHGGKRPTPIYGGPQYTFFLYGTIDTCPFWGHPGGTLEAAFASHHGVETSVQYVGSFVPINEYEAPPFDELYILWYKQSFCDNTFWILVGKTDAYDFFTHNELAEWYSNSGYTTCPNIAFFPAYPNPAMSIIGGISGDNLTFSAAVYDGSLAQGFKTGRAGIFGHFFDSLTKNAFLIGEVDWTWKWCKRWPGCLQLGVWKHTGRFTKFNGRRKNGTEGVYALFTQRLFYQNCRTFLRSLGFFAMFSVGDPAVQPVHYYSAVGIIWEGMLYYRPWDKMGIGMSRVDFTRDKEAEFRKRYEVSYEIYYILNLATGINSRIDYQYVVHPGGMRFPNASVFSLRLFFDF